MLVALGVGLAYLREDGQPVPGFVLHALFNAIARHLAVA